MSLLLHCACGKKLSVRDELAGKKVKCPGCGKVIVAEAPPVVVEAAEVTAEAPPPKVAAKKKTDHTAVSTAPTVKPVWTDDEKPKSSRKKKDEDDEEEERQTDEDDEEVERKPDEDDEDEEAKPGPHWVFPGTLSTEVMALAREGIWFASLKGDDLGKAVRRLKKGAQPSQVLGEKASYIPWLTITSIYCNKKLNGFTIAYTNEGESATKVMTPADREERDEIMKDIEKFMKPDVERTVKKHTPITAAVAPIITILVAFAITIGIAILSFFIGSDWEGRGRGALVALLFNGLSWLGPLGTCGIGFLIGLFILLWMMIRMINPPIEVTLKPVTSTESGEDEE